MASAKKFLSLLGPKPPLHESAARDDTPLHEGVPEVEIQTESIERWACPHCHERFHEKQYDRCLNEEAWRAGEERAVYEHSCGGRYMHPPPSPEEQAWLDNLLSH